jgi:hypothetical protein
VRSLRLWRERRADLGVPRLVYHLGEERDRVRDCGWRRRRGRLSAVLRDQGIGLSEEF